MSAKTGKGSRVPSHGEVASAQATKQLFRSHMQQLQIEALLKENHADWKEDERCTAFLGKIKKRFPTAQVIRGMGGMQF